MSFQISPKLSVASDLTQTKSLMYISGTLSCINQNLL